MRRACALHACGRRTIVPFQAHGAVLCLTHIATPVARQPHTKAPAAGLLSYFGQVDLSFSTGLLRLTRMTVPAP